MAPFWCFFIGTYWNTLDQHRPTIFCLVVVVVVSEHKSKIGRRRAPWPSLPRSTLSRPKVRVIVVVKGIVIGQQDFCHVAISAIPDLEVIYEWNHRISSILRDFNHRFWGESVIFDAWHPPQKWVKQGFNRPNGWVSPLEVRPGELLAPCGALKEWFFGGAEASVEKWPIPIWGWIIKLAAYFLGCMNMNIYEYRII